MYPFWVALGILENQRREREAKHNENAGHDAARTTRSTRVKNVRRKQGTARQ